MSVFLLRRLLRLFFVVLGVCTMVFVLLRLSGDPVSLLVPPDAPPDQFALVRERLGLDQPIYVQYVRFLGAAATGDLGESFRFRKPALQLVGEALPATLMLTMVALVLGSVLAVLAGVISAVWRGSVFDNVITLFSLLGQSVPIFWLGLLLILVFAVNLRLLPTSGSGTWQHLILPAVTLGAYNTARIARIARSGMLEVLGQDYIRTAHAKGLSHWRVIAGHALKNSAIPIITVIGFTFSALVGGSIITETIFAWPGVGRLMVQGVLNRDYPVVQAAVLVIALFVTAINLLVDLLYTYVDPRIRYS